MKKKVLICLAVLIAGINLLYSQSSPIIISEVFYDSPLNEDKRVADKSFPGNRKPFLPSNNGEFIELFNPTLKPINISGWYLDDCDSRKNFIFPANTIIQPRTSLIVVYRHPKTPDFKISQLFPEITELQEQTCVFYNADLVLTNDGDCVNLKNNKHELVDHVSWKSGRGKNPDCVNFWSIRASNGEGKHNKGYLSLQRKDIHSGTSKIYHLSTDYLYDRANPLSIDEKIYLPVLEDLYGKSELNTSLDVGTIEGVASVTSTGAAVYNIPLSVPPGINGMQPQLSIAYNSQSGFGLLGRCWDLSGISAISRGSQNLYYDKKNGKIDSKAIQFDNRDQLYIDGVRLILRNGTHFSSGAEYSAEVEDYSRVKILSKPSGDIYFQLTQNNGTTIEYGNSSNSSQKYKPSHIREITTPPIIEDEITLNWKVNKITDANGNSLEFIYTENGQYLKRINYLGTNDYIDFIYKVNNYNPRKAYINKFIVVNDRVLAKVDIYSSNTLLKFYEFTYNYDGIDTRLDAICEGIYENGSSRDKKRLNPTKINWGEGSNLERFSLGASGITNLNSLNGAVLYNGDFNGDGYSDLVEFWIGEKNKKGFIRVHLYNKTTKNYSIEPSYTYEFAGLKDNESDYYNKLTIGDTNNDGADEIILMERGVLKVFSYNKNTNSFNTPSSYDNIHSMGKSFHYADRQYDMVVNDFNNDGINDVIVFYNYYDKKRDNKKSTCFFFIGTKNNLVYSHSSEFDKYGFFYRFGNFGGNGSLWLKFIVAEGYSLDMTIGKYDLGGLTLDSEWRSFPHALGYLSDNTPALTGDFNGDGLTDILYQRDNNAWSVLSSRGDNNLSEILHTNIPAASSPISKDEKYKIFTLDYNGDGLTDVILADETWNKEKVNNSTFKKKVYKHTDWYFFTSTGKGFVAEKHVKNHLQLSDLNAAIMDVNGDGISDLVFSYGSGDTHYYYYSMPNASRKNAVTSITNGMGQSTVFTYKNYSNYNQGTNSGDLINLKSPIFVVDTHTDPSGNEFCYNYMDGKIHKEKGFIGFKKIEKINKLNDVKLLSEYEIDNQLYTIALKKETYTTNSSNVLTVDYTNSILKIDESKKIFIPIITNKKSIDYLNGNSEEISSIYNSNGTLASQTLKRGNVHETITKYENYKKSNNKSLIANLPGLVTVTMKYADQPSIETKTKYEYNQSGAISTKWENYETENEKTIKNNYFTNGVISSVSITPKNLPRLLNTYKYDDTFRYIIEESNNYGEKVTTKYNYTTGNILSITTPDGFTTYYKYDHWGRTTKETLPNGEEITHSFHWNLDENTLFTKVSTSKKIKNSVTVYYDYLGREVKTETTGWDGKVLVSENFYNNRNQLEKTTVPHFQNETELYSTYKYDYHNRISEINTFDGTEHHTTKYSYSKQKTTVTDSENRSSHTILNELGLTSESSDVLNNVINYKYNSTGHTTEITSNGSTIKIEYDKFGNQTKLNDPNTGIIKYSYYTDGKIKKEVTAKNDSTLYFYNNKRQLSKTTFFDNANESIIETIYTYVEEKNGKGKIRKIVQKENQNIVHSQEFKYNEQHLVTNKVEEYDGRTFDFKYEYDEYWRLIKSTSPNGVNVKNEYNEYGYLTKVYKDSALIWQLDEKNSKEQNTSFTLGNGLTTKLEFNDIGLLNAIKTGKKGNSFKSIQYHAYEYNNSTGNLIKRTDYKNNRNEEFAYDKLDRLTLAKLNNVDQYVMDYYPNGNIKEKTDVGTYKYDSNRPHAMIGVDNTGSGISDEEQIITYTGFNKIASVSQDRDNYTIQYGLDNQRIKTDYYFDGVRKTTRYYFGDYEIEIDSLGIETHINYIHTPSGLAAISNKKNNTEILYYVHTDHMGSIQCLTDNKGKIVSEYAYSPWGERILLNGQNITDRGYTQHEHLEALNLINMNGRVYDPVLARFLSPDPYIQASDFTQSYNRYTYCWNNPFKYTDPTGEFVFSALGPVGVIIDGALWGAVIAAATYTAQVAFSEYGFENWNNNDFWKSVGIGALSGAVTAGIGMAYGPVSINNFGVESLITEASRSITHGFAQGLISEFTGGSFAEGFAAGALSSFAGSMFMMTPMGGSSFGTYYFSAVSGGIGAELTGGDFWKGATIGIMNAGLNHLKGKVERYTFFNRLRNHYENGNGKDFKLTRMELIYLFEKGVISEKGENVGVRLYRHSINFYDSGSLDLALSFGNATIYLNDFGDVVDFFDTYDFDPKPWGTSRSYPNEIITRTYDAVSKGTPFRIYYNKTY